MSTTVPKKKGTTTTKDAKARFQFALGACNPFKKGERWGKEK